MKNITVSLDNDAYRNARVFAAEHDTSVSALVKEYLQSLTDTSKHQQIELTQRQDALLKAITERHKGFTSSENVTREELYR
ncbi:MAG: DUF6364 family protein [Opitutales bacterium]|nr:DUF6364 family protein [Opitutales bacterium]NRA27031.1 hypothetical protein [Opitutales bacterium]